MKNKGTSFEFVDTLWNFFTSVRLTVVLLLTLAATSIVGTLIPQNAAPADYIRKYGIELFRVFTVLDLVDMYHSWWFRFFMAMLTMNVVVCSLDRISATMKVVFDKERAFNVNRFRQLPSKVEWESSHSPAELVNRYAPLVSRWFGYSRIEESEKGRCILAEKGRWSRLGFYLVHLSIVLLLLGGLIGSIYGFDGFVNIPEGESAGQIRLNNSAKLVPLDFQIQCDDFFVSFYETGQPKEFRSRLTIIEAGTAVLTRDIIVNQPLRYKGINIFQSSYGQLSPGAVALTIKDRKRETEVSVKAAVGQAINLPGEQGTFVIKSVANTQNFRGMDLGQTLVGELTLTGKPPKEVLLPTRFPQFDKMRQGRFLISQEKLEHRYYTGLQVTRDPGVWLVYIGFILLIGGCLVTFFMSHQRLCIEIVPMGNGSSVLVAGSANKNKLGMQNKVKNISDRLAGQEAK